MSEKKKQGFAAMDPAKLHDIARKGGMMAHIKGTAHEWDAESARKAGAKGGTISRGGRGKVPEPAP